MEILHINDKQFPVLIDFGDDIRKLTKKASLELEDKLAEINLKLRLEDGE